MSNSRSSTKCFELLSCGHKDDALMSRNRRNKQFQLKHQRVNKETLMWKNFKPPRSFILSLDRHQLTWISFASRYCKLLRFEHRNNVNKSSQDVSCFQIGGLIAEIYLRKRFPLSGSFQNDFVWA